MRRRAISNVVPGVVLTLAVSLSTVPAFAGRHLSDKTAQKQGVKSQSGSMPVTAASSKGRELYQKGMEDYENLYLERCNDDWRAAVKEDP